MKITWGYEPKSQSAAAIKGMAGLLKQLSQGAEDISVGYVVTGNETYLHTAYQIPRKDRYSAYPKALILEDFKKAGVKVKADAVEIMDSQTMSITPAVDRLLKFAKTKRSRLLALYTHNRKGLERFIMGSFAETTVHRSKIDLLMAGPRTKYPAKVRQIFFASDFGPRSKKDLSRVLDLCRRMGARLTVFHAAHITYRWSLDENSPQIHAYRRKTKKMAEWTEAEAKRAGVACTVLVQAEFDPIPELISKAAAKVKADLLILSAKAGPFAALIGGSVTRNVLRRGAYPLLILKS